MDDSKAPSSSSRKITSDNPVSDKDRSKRKASKKAASAAEPSSKPKRSKSPKNSSSVASVSSASSPPNKKRKSDKNASKRKSTDTGDSDEESIDDSQKDYSGMIPEVGDEVAIKCPPDPPYPEGWYSGVIIEVVRHDQGLKPSGKGSKSKQRDFTVHVEWDGGGVEQIRNPEWRMKGDEPDKQGRISHRDARLRPYFKYWVNRLNSINESEKKLNRTRAGKNMRIDSNQKIEWIKCSNPNCGKWRALPTYLKSSSVLESCNNTWFCVLNTWDEGMASCAAHQETGYMPLDAADD